MNNDVQIAIEIKLVIKYILGEFKMANVCIIFDYVHWFSHR